MASRNNGKPCDPTKKSLDVSIKYVPEKLVNYRIKPKREYEVEWQPGYDGTKWMTHWLPAEQVEVDLAELAYDYHQRANTQLHVKEIVGYCPDDGYTVNFVGYHSNMTGKLHLRELTSRHTQLVVDYHVKNVLDQVAVLNGIMNESRDAGTRMKIQKNMDLLAESVKKTIPSRGPGGRDGGTVSDLTPPRPSTSRQELGSAKRRAKKAPVPEPKRRDGGQLSKDKPRNQRTSDKSPVSGPRSPDSSGSDTDVDVVGYFDNDRARQDLWASAVTDVIYQEPPSTVGVPGSPSASDSSFTP